MAADFTLDDLAAQLHHLKQLPSRPDPIGELLDYFRSGQAETLARVERILAATEPAERREPFGIGPAQRQRIAADSGVELSTVESFFAGFERLRGRMRELAGMNVFQRVRVAFRGGLPILLPWLLVVGLVVARLAGW